MCVVFFFVENCTNVKFDERKSWPSLTVDESESRFGSHPSAQKCINNECVFDMQWYGTIDFVRTYRRGGGGGDRRVQRFAYANVNCYHSDVITCASRVGGW